MICIGDDIVDFVDTAFWSVSYFFSKLSISHPEYIEVCEEPLPVVTENFPLYMQLNSRPVPENRIILGYLFWQW